MKLNRNNHTGRLLTCLALVMAMAFVYPVHVIVDHAGLPESHLHDNDDEDHSGDQAFEDEICMYCLTLDSMEITKSQELKYEIHAGDYDAQDLSIVIDSPMGSIYARSPPVSFDFSPDYSRRDLFMKVRGTRTQCMDKSRSSFAVLKFELCSNKF